jgi:hypothetical protein
LLNERLSERGARDKARAGRSCERKISSGDVGVGIGEVVAGSSQAAVRQQQAAGGYQVLLYM